MSKLISTAEYAAKHGKSPRVVRQKILDGTLPAKMIGGRYAIREAYELTCVEGVEVKTPKGCVKMWIEHDGAVCYLVSEQGYLSILKRFVPGVFKSKSIFLAACLW